MINYIPIATLTQSLHAPFSWMESDSNPSLLPTNAIKPEFVPGASDDATREKPAG